MIEIKENKKDYTYSVFDEVICVENDSRKFELVGILSKDDDGHWHFKPKKILLFSYECLQVIVVFLAQKRNFEKQMGEILGVK